MKRFFQVGIAIASVLLAAGIVGGSRMASADAPAPMGPGSPTPGVSAPAPPPVIGPVFPVGPPAPSPPPIASSSCSESPPSGGAPSTPSTIAGSPATTPSNCNGDDESSPAASAGSGIDGLVPAPDLRGGNQPTLMEKYPPGAYTLDTNLGVRDQGDWLLNGFANAVFHMVVGIGVVTSRVVQWVFSFNLFGHTGNSISEVVGELTRNLYNPFVIPMIVIAAAWMAWHGLARRRGTMAMEGAVWVVAALAGAGWFMGHPQSIVNGANDLSTSLSRSVLAGVGHVDPHAALPDNAGASPTYSGDPANAELRSAADAYWATFVYYPWLVAEFGSIRAGEDHDRGAQVLSSKSANEHNLNTAPERAAWANHDAAGLISLKNQEYDSVRDRLYNADDKLDDEAHQAFNGHRAGNRLGMAVVALVAISLASVVMLLMAGGVLMASIALLMLVLLAPIFLLLGIHPTTGRRMLLKWVELCVGVLIKRVAYATFLAVILTMTVIILASALRIGWIIAVLLVVGLFLMAVIYRKPFLALFAAMGSVSGSPSGEHGWAGRAVAGLAGAAAGVRLAGPARRTSAGIDDGSAALPANRTAGEIPSLMNAGPSLSPAAVKGRRDSNGGTAPAGTVPAATTAAAASGAVSGGGGGAAGGGVPSGALGGHPALGITIGSGVAGGVVVAEKLRQPIDDIAAAGGNVQHGRGGVVGDAATAAAATFVLRNGEGLSATPAQLGPSRRLDGGASGGPGPCDAEDRDPA
ncbi:MAG TPA: type IV secretion system protein [Actinomycetota bacterium]|nr:type IV secretion system protein [Actinomycetota bacterium]